MSVLISGECEPAFAALADLLTDELSCGRAIGQAVAVVVDGETVVNLWGGHRDANRTIPWGADTLVCLFSAGKPVAAAAVLKLVERGKLDLDAPVARYWPEFAAAGKNAITVRQALAHLAAIPIAAAAPAGSVFEHAVLIDALEAQPPLWAPGTQGCFHSFTHGLLSGELVRRADGRAVGEFVRAELAEPHQLAVHFALSADEQARCADVVTIEDNPLLQMMRDPATLLGQSWRPMRWDQLNSVAFRGCDFPSLAGHGSALGLARFYGMLACNGMLDGRRVLDESLAREFVTQQWHQPDPFMGAPVRMGLGVMLASSMFSFTGNQSSFAQPGLGGVVGMGDTTTRIGIGVTPNRLVAGLANPFMDAIVATVIDCL